MIPLVIARNTFREATRDRVLAGAIVAGIVLLLVTQLMSPLALGEGHRLTVDLGLSGISILGLLIVVLIGTSMVGRELEKRTIYNLLSRPIARHQYLIGKWAGLSATLWVVTATLGVALWLVLAARGHLDHGPAVIEASYMAGLELTVVTSLAVLFSAMSTPVLSALYTLAAYVIGQWSYDLRTAAADFPPELRSLLRGIANVVPNLPVFNMRTLASEAHTTSAVHLGVASLYALVYCACALALATAAFETKDFK